MSAETKERLALLSGPVLYRCLCCGVTATFPNEQEAFEAGWDTPTWFPPEGLASPLCCSCPTTSYLSFDIDPAKGYAVPNRGQHDPEHQQWLRDGVHPSGKQYRSSDYLPPQPLEAVLRYAAAVRRQLEQRN